MAERKTEGAGERIACLEPLAALALLLVLDSKADDEVARAGGAGGGVKGSDLRANISSR